MPATDACRIHMLLPGPSEAKLRQRIAVIPRAKLSQTCAKPSGFLCVPWCWAASLYPLFISLSSFQLLICHTTTKHHLPREATLYSAWPEISQHADTLRHRYLPFLRQLWSYISWGKTSKHPSKMPSLFGIDAQPEHWDFYCNPTSFPLPVKNSIPFGKACCPFPSLALFFWNHQLRWMYFIRERNKKGKRQMSTPSFFPCHCCSLRSVVPTLLAASGDASPDVTHYLSLGGSLEVGSQCFPGEVTIFSQCKGLCIWMVQKEST